MNPIAAIARGLLTLVLLGFVYVETGWATTLAIGLCVLANEMCAEAIRRRA